MKIKPTYKMFLLIGLCSAIFGLWFITGCGKGGNPAPAARSLTWCHPLPQGYSLQGVWGSSPSNIFIVGDYGSIWRFDGSSWKIMATGTTEYFFSVWGTGNNNVYASSDYAIYHYDGSSWQKCYQYTGENNPHFNPIWGSSASDIFIGGAGVMLHYNGTSWATMEIGTDFYVKAIWGTSSRDVYAVCNDFALIYHYDGAAWTKVNESVHQTWLGSVWGSAANDIYAAGGYPFAHQPGEPVAFHYDGTVWSEVSYDFGGRGVQKIWGTASNDVYALDAGAKIHHFNGTDWTQTDIGLDFLPADTWFYDQANLYFVGSYGVIARYDGANLTFNVESKDRGQLNTVYAFSSNNIYTGGGEYIMHYNGTSWESVYLGFGNSTDCLWGTSPTNLYAVGGVLAPRSFTHGFIARYDGNDWTQVHYDAQMGFAAVWGSSADDIFVASPSGRMMHYNGTTWESDNLVWNGIYRLWGTAGNDVYAGCNYGTIIHYDGASWEVAYSLGGDDGVMGLTGFSSRDVYAGAGSSLIHFNGTTWEVIASTGGEDSIVRLWGSSGSDLYVLCSGGGLYYYNGHNLTALPELWKATQGIYGIGGPSTDDIYFVGIGGTILRYH